MTTNGLQFRKLSANIGVEAAGIDLNDELSPEVIRELRSHWLDASVLLIRGQNITPDTLLRFSGYFGKSTAYTLPQNALDKYPAILVLSNLVKDGRPMGAPSSSRYWHTDGHFLRIPPCASILYGAEVPETGGDTLFASCVAAYASLSPEIRERIDGRRVIISRVQARPITYPDKPPVSEEERAAWPDMPQPLVRTHPESGRRALYIGGAAPWRVEGMPDEEGSELIGSLQRFLIRDEFLYRHQWVRGDLLMWDNRSCIHRATAYDEVGSRRLMYRTTIEGDLPFFDATR